MGAFSNVFQITNACAARGAAGAAVAVLLFGSGCVSSGEFTAMRAERDLLEGEKEELTTQVSALNERAGALESDLAKKNAEVAEMRGTYDGLVTGLEAELASGKVQIEQMSEGGIRVNLAQDILFSTGSAQLGDEGKDVLGKVSDQLGSGSHNIAVGGHSDDRPISGKLQSRYPTNWELAGARAASVVRLLEEQGVDRTRLRAVSYADTQPVASNDDDEGRAKNRRIDIRLIPSAGK